MSKNSRSKWRIASKPPSQRVIGSDEDRKTAIHEAGHAVAYVLLGFEVKRVEIKERKLEYGYSRGFTDCGTIKNESIIGKGRDAVMPLLVGLASGVVAESHVNPSAFEGSGRSDLEMAQKFAMMAVCDYKIEGDNGVFSPDEDRISGLIHDAIKEANRLINENIEAVLSVSRQLLARGWLAGSDVIAIVNDSRTPDLRNASGLP